MPGVSPASAIESTPHQVQMTSMLIALGATGKHVYEGTVPDHVVARRRKANRAARVARRRSRR